MRMAGFKDASFDFFRKAVVNWDKNRLIYFFTNMMYGFDRIVMN